MKGLPKYCLAPTLMEQMTLWDRASAMVAKGPYVGQLIYHCRYSGKCKRARAFLMEICGVGNGRANNKSMRIAEVGVINTENAQRNSLQISTKKDQIFQELLGCR